MDISDLKKEAQMKLQGKWGKVILISVIYSLFSLLLSAIRNFIDNDILSTIYSLILIVIDVPFTYGFAASLLKLYRGEDVKPLDFITIGLQAFKKSWSVTLHTFLKLIVPIILIVVATVITAISLLSTVVSSSASSQFGLAIICVILVIVLYIYLFIKSLLYALTSFIIYDEENLSGKEIVEKSAKLMIGNRKKYVGLYCSFILYYLAMGIIVSVLSALGTVVAGIFAFIIYVFLEIYISFTVLAFYNDLIDKKETETVESEIEQ